MKKFTDIRKNIKEAAASTATLNPSVDQFGAAISVHQVNDPRLLQRLNAFVGSISNHSYSDPQEALHTLQTKLHTIGFIVDLSDSKAQDTETYAVKQYGGRFGFLDDSGEVKSKDQFGAPLVLQLEFRTLENNTVDVIARLFPQDVLPATDSVLDDIDESRLHLEVEDATTNKTYNRKATAYILGDLSEENFEGLREAVEGIEEDSEELLKELQEAYGRPIDLPAVDKNSRRGIQAEFEAWSDFESTTWRVTKFVPQDIDEEMLLLVVLKELIFDENLPDDTKVFRLRAGRRDRGGGRSEKTGMFGRGGVAGPNGIE